MDPDRGHVMWLKGNGLTHAVQDTMFIYTVYVSRFCSDLFCDKIKYIVL